MSEPYLILHKVRGEPTFDIAIKLIADKTFLPDEEEIWIIPTSGHRAYPLWAEPLDHFAKLNEGMLTWISDKPAWGYGTASFGDKLAEWPDHYSCNDRKASQDVYEVKARAASLLENLGLVKKVTMERRF